MDVNKTFKGACSVCLAAFLAFPMSSFSSVLAGISDSGDCSAVGTGSSTNSVSWEVTAEGVLTISGSGEMEDFAESISSPWYDKASNITSIVIEDGVTSIGNYAFYGLNNAETVEIPSSVKRIGVDAFKGAKCEAVGEDGVRYAGGWLTGFDSTEENKSSDIKVASDTIGIADFASSGIDVSSILLPESIKHIGENSLKGSSLKSVYFEGNGENLNINEIRDKVAAGVEIYYTVVNGQNISVENVNETLKYHVGERPTFSATLTDNGGTAPRLTMEEKWVNISDSTDEITKDNNNKFKENVKYKYVIILKLNSDKFNFQRLMAINNKSVEVDSASPLTGTVTFRDVFNALISIDSVEVSKSENFDISCNTVGSKPKFAQSVSANANYSISYEAWEKVNSSGKVEKRVVSGDYPSSGTEVAKLENFEENGLYKYTVCLLPKDKYYFNPSVSTKLGGESVKNSVITEEKVVMTSAVLGTKHYFPLTTKERVEPTCTKPGNIKYYQCPTCTKLFADENAQSSLTYDDTVLAIVDHTYEKVEAKEPTCTEKGNIEYFKCKECGKLFKSENGQAGKEITDASSVEIEMIPHTFDESTFISDGENGHYHKCKYCDAHSETVAHTFGEAWLSDSESHYHKCKDCDYKKDVTKHTFDKKVEDKKYLKDGLTCGDVISYYKSCECGESSKGTKSEETFENEKGKKVEHEFGKDGVCTICKATDYKLSAVDGNTYTETENGSLVFRANGSLDKLSSVKVDGTVLTKDKDYTVKSGSTIVELKNDYLKTLSAGDHTLTLVYEDGECETKFDVKAADSKTGDDESKTDDGNGSKGNVISDIIYKTGDNPGLISLISTVLTSGLASVWFAKKRRKNR